MMKIIAITDETSTCECCGKTNLKKVIVMQNDNGDIVRYGTDCAAKAQGMKRSALEPKVTLIEDLQRWLKKYDAIEKVQAACVNKYCFVPEVRGKYLMLPGREFFRFID